MDKITVIWSMTAAACLTLAIVQTVVVVTKRADWWQLFFVSGSVAAAGVAGAELLMMNAVSAEEYGLVLRWANVGVFVMLVSLVWYVYFDLGTGRRWLAWLITAIRLVILPLKFIGTTSINF